MRKEMTMKSFWTNAPRFLTAALLATAAASPAHADGQRTAVRNPAYQQECSACHVAYPPQFLSAASWRAVMDGLDKHFGSDASLEPAAHAEILRYLEAYAGRRDTAAAGKPQLRITETRWFVHEHSEELPANVWKNPAVKSAANCMACHTVADKGDFSERSLRLPKGVYK
jgi:nitrate/TMAO reductase-like tetraheme cytochrome c subunit